MYCSEQAFCSVLSVLESGGRLVLFSSWLIVNTVSIIYTGWLIYGFLILVNSLGCLLGFFFSKWTLTNWQYHSCPPVLGLKSGQAVYCLFVYLCLEHGQEYFLFVNIFFTFFTCGFMTADLMVVSVAFKYFRPNCILYWNPAIKFPLLSAKDKRKKKKNKQPWTNQQKTPHRLKTYHSSQSFLPRSIYIF